MTTKSPALLVKVTKRPSELITGESDVLPPLPVPALLMLASDVVLATRFRTKMSDVLPFVSLATRLLALLVKATE